MSFAQFVQDVVTTFSQDFGVSSFFSSPNEAANWVEEHVILPNPRLTEQEKGILLFWSEESLNFAEKIEGHEFTKAVISKDGELKKEGIPTRYRGANKDLDDKTAAAINAIKIKGIIKQGDKGMELRGGEVEVKTIDIKGTLTDAAKYFGLFDKDNQQSKYSLEDILNALPKEFADGVRQELRKVIAERGNKVR